MIKTVEDLDYKSKTNKSGFISEDESYPRSEYENSSSTNRASRGIVQYELYSGGGTPEVRVDLPNIASSRYPDAKIEETSSGHVLEVNDSPGAERILHKHRLGSGIDLRPDGSIIISSKKHTIRISGADEKVIIDGDCQMSVKGNLDLTVSGDMNLSVGGNMNILVGGDVQETVDGSERKRILKNEVKTVQKNKTTHVLGQCTDIRFKDYFDITKGSKNTQVKENCDFNIGGSFQLTSEKPLDISSENINIAAKAMSVISDSGTIGGDNVVFYGEEAKIDSVIEGDKLIINDIDCSNRADIGKQVNSPFYTGELFSGGLFSGTGLIINDVLRIGINGGQFNGTFRANVFVAEEGFIGNLSGNATTASSAPDGPGGRTPSISDSGFDDPDEIEKDTATINSLSFSGTVKPTSQIMNDYLSNSGKGIKRVKIDVDDVIFNKLDHTNDFSGVSSRKLTTEEVRNKLRDPANRNNEQFVGSQVIDNKLSPNFVKSAPQKIGRVESRKTIKRGNRQIGNISNSKTKKFEY